MNLNELRMVLRPLPFLDAHAPSQQAVAELRPEPIPKLLVWDPEAIEWIFRSDQHLDHPGSRSLTPLFGRSSLLWVDGPRHTAYRRGLGPRLRGRRLTDYQPVISQAVHAAIDELARGTTVSLPEWTRRVALRIIGRITLGCGDDEVLDPFSRWIENALGSRGRALAYRFFRGGLPESSAELDGLLVRTAKDRAGAEPHTLAGLMLAGEGALGTVDDGELRDQIVSLLFAGHETTASTTAWVLYHLDRDDRLRDDVRAELAATSDDGSDPTRMPLLHAVIQEALRLAPPVTVAENRTLTESADILGRHLPRGTVLTPSIYLAHRNPRHFADPCRFDPHRFLGHRPQPHRYFPFGGGTRHCLGSQLALLEIRMITAALLRRREWECVNPHKGVPRLRGHAMAPDSRLRMRVLACSD